MKKIGSLLTVAGFFLSVFSISHQLQPKTVTPLSEIIKTMNATDVTIEKWELLAKDDEVNVTDRSGYENFVQRIKNQLPQFKWREPLYNKNVIRLTGIQQTNEGKITETVMILTQVKKDAYESRLIYEMTGNDWKDIQTNDVFSLFSTRTYELFSKSPSFYTCVTGKKVIQWDLL